MSNQKNPKFNDNSQNERFDGFNMVQLADPGLPFIKNFKQDIRVIGRAAQDISNASGLMSNRGVSAGGNSLPQLKELSNLTLNRLGLNKGSLRSAYQTRKKVQAEEALVQQTIKSVYGARLDAKSAQVRGWM